VTAAALTLAAFVQLAGQCAPNVASETLAAVARTESAFRPLAIGINGPGGGSVQPSTVAEAVERASTLIAAGRSVDLGLMQINNRNLAWLGLTIADAFDPCRSIAAGAKVLTAFSGYNTGHPQRGFSNGYVARVVASHQRNSGDPAAAVAPAAAPVAAAPTTSPAPADHWDVWALPAPAPEPAPVPVSADTIEAQSADEPRLVVELKTGD
jgi:type IV secretion system protein VirB1